MSSYPIEDIEGIGPVYAEKLKAAGIKTTEALLDRAKGPKDRKDLAAATGIEEVRILKWANHADLMRLKGVGKQFAELLEAAGVDTVKELRNRRADNLHAKMVEVNTAKGLSGTVPSEAQLAALIAQAKELPPILTY
jgi:predicted flap endonuclease-1-like 5' DNA nuclease